jgi:hypothetical protein
MSAPSSPLVYIVYIVNIVGWFKIAGVLYIRGWWFLLYIIVLVHYLL